MIHATALIHPLACVDDSVRIGARVRVWQFSTVIRGTALGDDTKVASGATLDGPVIGKRCIVSPGVDIGPGFVVGDDVFLGPNVVLCNDAWPRTHKAGWDADELRPAANGWLGVDVGRACVIVCDGASIGANAVVLPGVTVGARAMIAAGAVCSRDVPAGHLLRTNGTLEPITSKRQRMRFAGGQAGRSR